ncbi:MAG: transketolase [Acidobacteria bacterium]|nr:transketolase [Acidobacteriota bacterium]
MRNAFIRSLTELARRDPRIFLLVGDLGYSVVEPFRDEFPERFVNVGVAEQNMTGLAAGLALSGKIVFTYSIANFPTLRCLEQVRNDVCYHRANVKIVAVGGGLAYGALGITHHGTEDVAILRALPGMTVVAPADPMEAALATRAIAAWPGPCYLRLGKAGEPSIHAAPPDFRIGRPIELRQGEDAVILASGPMTRNALLAAEKLSGAGISVGLYSVHTVKPLDEEFIRQLARQVPFLFVVEEHSVIGGLGSAIAEVVAEISGTRPLLKRLALPDSFHPVGSQEFLCSTYLSAEALFTRIHATLSRVAAKELRALA